MICAPRAEYEPEGASVSMRIFYPTHARPSRVALFRPANVESWRLYYGMLLFEFSSRLRALGRAGSALVEAFCFVVWVIMRCFATVQATKNAPVIDDGKALDVIVFSHGLAGFGTCNANFAVELARRGFIVACVEHRDGSAVAYKRVVKSDGWRRRCRRVEWSMYVPNGGKFECRREQTTERVAEIVAAARCVDEINEGTFRPNLRDFGANTSTRVLSSLRQRLNVDSKTLCGFSFGGGAAVTASADVKDFKRVVALDAWLEYMTDEKMLSRACKLPTLSVISEKWGANAKTNNAFHLKRGKKQFYEIEIPNSRHHDFSDVSFFLAFAKKTLGMTGKINVRIFHAFLADLTASFARVTSSAEKNLARVVSEYSADLPYATFRKWNLDE